MLVDAFIVDERIKEDYIFNKDAHPENWIIEYTLIPELKQPKIIAIDWDEKGLTFPSEELVNLFDYTETLLWEQRLDLAEQYLRNYHSYKSTSPTKQDIDLFQLAYLNSVYERSIGLCFAWSSESRPSMHASRLWLLENSLSSIEVIQSKYRWFHTAHMERLKSRQKALELLIDSLS